MYFSSPETWILPIIVLLAIVNPLIYKNESVTMPAILSHPSLVDARWIQPDVFEALEVEQVLLHPNQVFVLQLIETFQLIDIHPYQKFEVFQKLMKHLSSSSDVDSSLIYNNSNSFFSNSHSNSHLPKAEHQRMPPGSFLR